MLLIVFSTAYSLFAVFSVAMIMPAINLIFDPESFLRLIGPHLIIREFTPLWLTGVLILAWLCFALKNGFYFLSNRYREKLEAALMMKYGQKVYAPMLTEPLERYYNVRHASRIQRVTAVVRDYVRLRVGAVTMMSRVGPLLVGYGLILFWISLPITFTVLLALPLMTALAQWKRRRIEKEIRLERNAWDKLHHLVHQSLSAMRLVRLLNATGYEIYRYRDQMQLYLHHNAVKENLQDRKLIFLEMTGVSVGLLVLIMTGYAIQSGQFHSGPGGLVLFVASVFSMIDPAKGLVKSLQDFRTSTRIQTDLNRLQEEQQWKTIRIDHFGTEIEWRKVSYRYPGQTGYVFQEANLQIRPKDRIFLTGESGSGKSTFVDLTTGLLQPQEGEIVLDHQRIFSVHPEDISRLVGVMTQEPLIFHDTLRRNLDYPENGYPDALLYDALEKAGLRAWFGHQTEGFDTIIGERGATLSGGEKQRLALARLILRNPEVLILDEATSGLDVEMETALISRIMDLFTGRTIILISHRLSLSAFATRHIRIAGQKFLE